MPQAWRIVPERRADDAFNGEGARLYGGRFNLPGSRAVYASEHLSLAALELLVHIRPLMPLPCVAFPLEWFTPEVEILPVEKLPPDWRQEPAPRSSAVLGDAWLQSRRTALLAVPSVIVPQERNFVLNPAHPDFPLVHVGRPEPFTFDPRLWSPAPTAPRR
jgi:RES domain-containing protein